MSLVGFSQVGLFVIVLFYVLHEMKPVLLPLVLAILVSLIVHPVYVGFRALRIPKLLSATATVCGLMAVIIFAAYQAFLPGAEWARTVDQEKMLGKVQEVFRPMKQVQADIKKVAQKVQDVANEAPAPVTEANRVADDTGSVFSEKDANKVEAKKAQPVEFKPMAEAPFLDEPEVKVEPPPAAVGAPVMVEIHEDPVTMLLTETRDFGLGLLAFLLLVLFILAYGNRITRQLSENETAEAILERMGKDVSRYMFTITIINAGLGICIGLAMWGMGMPRPALWGVMAMLLNFIPYLGAFAGTLVIFLAAVVNFESPGMVLAVPVVYFALTAIEGNLVTPTVLGGRFRINPLVVFVWIFAWAGFWGVAGMLIAMPALVIFKIVCENTQKMDKLRRVLGA
jgi:predicted PurR-regulated permease PerM